MLTFSFKRLGKRLTVGIIRPTGPIFFLFTMYIAGVESNYTYSSRNNEGVSHWLCDDSSNAPVLWWNLKPGVHTRNYACLRPDGTVASKSGRDSSAFIAPTEPRTRSRHDPDLATLSRQLHLSVIYMHHGAIWCLDTHQELQRLWLADALRLASPDTPGEIWADWDEIQSLVTRDLVSGRTGRKSGRNR